MSESGPPESTSTEPSEQVPSSPTRKWLAAVEAAEIKDVEAAEELALAAYRANEMDLAQRWIKRASSSPVAQWLQAKLLLRAGKVQAAAELLAKIAPDFPVAPQGTNQVAPAALKDTLFIDRTGRSMDRLPVERQVLGELGAVRLSRRDFVQALDALLNAGFWMDAAFVAERVLSVDELRAYVDAHWPAVSAGQAAEEKVQFGSDEICPAKLREQIRYLLARRLTRSFRSDEARPYYPVEWLTPFDLLVQGLKTGWDEALPADQRAKALFEAAVITRTNGMELIGTEVEPDWHVHGGEFEEGVTTTDRVTNEDAAILVASAEEVHRSAEHHADPEMRFHYRYQAAALAWEAAKLMPNNSDATAYVLWTAGCWLKNRDPQTADLFYKALVWRNRKTALGAEADRRRWFPRLDENGNIVPRPPRIEAPVQEPDAASTLDTAAPQNEIESGNITIEPGPETTQDELETMRREADAAADLSAVPPFAYEYVVKPGDTLASIATAFARAGITVSIDQIIQANDVQSTRLKVGQRLLVPVSDGPSALGDAEVSR
jgi:LysM repeat protein